MADNITLNAGTGGSVVSTDEVTRATVVQHVQYVKLMNGTDAAIDVIPGDATNGLDVDVTRVSGNVTVVQATASNLNATVTGTVEIGATSLSALETINAAQSGTWTVGLSAGTNNIGDVDVLSVVPGTGATNAGKAVDSAAGATDTGVAMLAVRDDALTTLTPVDGDYTNLRVDSTGALHVRVSAGGIAGKAEDAAHTTADEGIVILAVRRDAASSGVDTDGDYATLSVTSDGSLRVSGSSGTTQYAEDAASAGGESLCLAGAVRQDTLASNTSLDGDYTYLKTTSAGRLYTDAVVSSALPAGTNNIGDVDVLTLPNVTLAAGTNTNEVVGDVAQDAAVAGNPLLAGARASTATPTAMSADGDAVYQWADRNGAIVVTGRLVDDAAFTPGTDRVVPVGFIVDETATDAADEGDIGAARMTADREVIIVPYAHAGAGGASPYKSLDLDETEEEVKASAAKLFWVHAINVATSVRYLKFYNATAANVTVGTTTPVMTLPIPTVGSTNGAGFTIHFGDIGVQFATALTIAATTGLADNDTGAPGANEVVVNLGYI